MEPDLSHVGFIFDCDGTLIDSIGAWLDAEASVARAAGVALSKEQRDRLNTLTLPEAGEFFHRCFGIGASGAAVAARIDAFMLDFYRQRAEGRPGALAFVRRLRERGARITVASSSPRSFLEAGLERAGFSPFLDAIVSVDDVEGTKRDPFIFRRCCEIMGVEPQCSWGFDDSAYALESMAAAGVRCVGVYSSPSCSTESELAAVSDLVIPDFLGLDLRRFAL